MKRDHDIKSELQKKILLSGSDLTVADIHQVAVHHSRVILDDDQLQRVQACYDRVQRWGEEKQPIYGVTTGFGELINRIIPPEFKSELQRNLLCSHAAGSGAPFPEEIVRAIMAVRINCLMKGHSGVSPEAVILLKEFLNRDIHPVIPQQGSLGASGDLAPLSHMALPLIGMGRVQRNGKILDADVMLREEGLVPIQLGFKEALSLVNGTSAMTGAASIALVRARRILRLAVVATLDVVQCLQGSTSPFDPSGHILKNHRGQVIIARELKRYLSDSSLTRRHSDIMKSISEEVGNRNGVAETDIYLQNAYSLRCIPQVLGPVLDTLEFCQKIVEEEINSANDNPLFFQTPEKTFHGANFHGQYIAMVCDYLNIALTEIGVLAERQLDRLLSPHLNGTLPPFLANGESGLFCGFEGGQYLATSIASENLGLAGPASIKSIPSNGANQDIVSMGLIAARKTIQLCDNVSTILLVLLAACFQAAHTIGFDGFSEPIRRLHGDMSDFIPNYRDDFPISDIFTSLREYLSRDAVMDWLEDSINLEADN